MFGMSNTLIRDTIEFLKDPERWSSDGKFAPGKSCIVTALFGAACNRNGDFISSRAKARRAIQRAIKVRYGLSRGYDHDPDATLYPDIIAFNDHPLTTHADVMSVLYQAEKYTRPFWRGRVEA